MIIEGIGYRADTYRHRQVAVHGMPVSTFFRVGVPGGKFTAPQVRALVELLKDIVMVLAEADHEDKAELHAELGVDLTYHPEGRVTVEMKPRGVKGWCRRTDTRPNYTAGDSGEVLLDRCMRSENPADDFEWDQRQTQL